MPIAWLPNRRSPAIATQSFPTMAMTEPPLYCMIDYRAVVSMVKIQCRMHAAYHNVQRLWRRMRKWEQAEREEGGEEEESVGRTRRAFETRKYALWARVRAR